MESCIYKIENIKLPNTIFDNVCDCTYVILCCGENPKRLPSVIEQIQVLRPTKNIKLIFNKGYKNCPLSCSVNNDLLNIQTYVFKDAISNGYDRILYLEDDFELKSYIPEKSVHSITNFIKQNDPNVYSLGCMSIPTLPTLLNTHQKSLFNMHGLTHALFYNSDFMIKYINYFNTYTGDISKVGIDVCLHYIPNISVYRYYKPLVFQKLPSTENQREGWKNQSGEITTWLGVHVIMLLSLDKQLEPGYTVIYVIPYLVYLILFILVVYILKRINC